jgi:RDD family protein
MLNKEGTVPRALIGIALVSSFVWFYWFQKNATGYFSETKNGVTHVVAGSSPAVVSLSILGILLFIFLMTREVHVETFQAASLRRRFVAFLFDCWFLLLTVAGTSSLLHLLMEALRSGTFRWRYEQESGGGPDGADTVLILANLIVMLMYFVIPLARRRQTVGQWLLRLATVSAGGSVLYLPFSTAMWRTYMAPRGLFSPWRLLKETDAQGRTWYDRETGFIVVRY